MKVTINKSIDFEAKYLQVEAHVRYWEDSLINGKEDTEDGDNIPCKDGENWSPKINIDTGVIENWEVGKTADIHYKVCDECRVKVLDVLENTIFEQDDYVPSILCPREEGFGDYIMMDISSNGSIQLWNKHKLLDLINCK